MCVFLYTRVFYHCPTTSVAPRLENTCRPGRKRFQNQNQDRPCVGHAAVRATLDRVHRATVLCSIEHALCCATVLRAVGPALAVPPCSSVLYSSPALAVPPCSSVLYSSPAVSPVLCSRCAVSIPPCRRGGLVMEVHGRPQARSGARYQSLPTVATRPNDPGAPSTTALPCLTTPPDQTKIQVILHVESPTRPYQDPCPLSVCDWLIWSGAGVLTIPYQSTLLAVPPL